MPLACVHTLLVVARSVRLTWLAFAGIYEPTWFERYTLMVGTVTAFTLFFVITCMMYCRRRLVQRSLAKKAERRRSRRSSEQEPVQAPKSAFGHA